MLALGTFLRPELVLLLRATTKAEALGELVAAAVAAQVITEPDELLGHLAAREARGSTGLGLGVAIPHAKLDHLPKMVLVVGLARQGIDFDSPDGDPVQLIFMVAASNHQALYLQLIARISWLVRNETLRQQLLHAPDAATLYQLLSVH